MTFYCHTLEDGRIVLDESDSGDVLQTIEAPDWQTARLMVVEAGMYYRARAWLV